MDSARKQLVEKLGSANHVLVTVSRNPSVDQLAACIGLTLVLNKLGKHGTAVFSGEVPSTLEFLQPEETLEKNTDSLRDFIIALDKGKADKLRYKVEDNVVRIFITPYRTSISEQDLNFSQGDFNVDVVIALGVQNQEDLDQAITSHGRILHDATVATVTVGPESDLGSINWNDPGASSLSELVAGLAQTLGTDVLDNQISTALLTGIVAETARFSNEKTSPQTMSISAALMAAGANQQLVASKLEEPAPKPAEGASTSTTDLQSNQQAPEDQPEAQEEHDGSLDISHGDGQTDADAPKSEENLAFDSGQFDITDAESSPKVPESTQLNEQPSELPAVNTNLSSGGKLITEPPAMSGQLTANSTPETTAAPVNLLNSSGPTTDQPLLQHNAPVHDTATADKPEPEEPAAVPPQPMMPATPEPTTTPPEPVIPGFTPPPPAWVPPEPADDKPQTLSDLETAVHNQESKADGPNLDAARDEVMKALDVTSESLPPVESLNAQPIFDQSAAAEPGPVVQGAEFTEVPDAENIPTLPVPPVPGMGIAPTTDTTPQVTDPTAPPPVPPPIPFNFGNPPSQTPPAT